MADNKKIRIVLEGGYERIVNGSKIVIDSYGIMIRDNSDIIAVAPIGSLVYFEPT